MEIKVKIVKLFVQGYSMKKFACVMITTLAIGSVLTACSEEKEETKVETNSELDISNSLKKDGSGVYTYTISGTELLGKGNIEYYLKISDGQNPVTTDTQTIEIESSDVKVSGLNLTEGSVLNGKASVKSYGTNDKLMIGSQDVTAQTTPALLSDAYFVFEADKVDNYFQNAVTMGDEVLDIYNYRITQYTTLSVPIVASKIQKGEKTTLSIRAGTKMSPFDEASTENRDDFIIRNVRLVLEDGTIIYDPNYSDAEEELVVSNGTSATKVYDFGFDIPEEFFRSKAYELDTAQLEDGTYTVSSGTETVEDGKEYKGKFTIAAEMIDDSTVSEVKVTLDGEAISLPYDTSSAKLKPGEHTLSIETTDIVGNTSIKTIVFSTTTEMPNAPEILSPAEGSTLEDTDVDLKVKVTDPTADKMKVQLMEVDLGPQEKLVATDSFKVQVYTDNLIDEVKEVKSGEIAQTTLKNLKTNTKYGWYANIEDDYDGQTRSDVQLFTTGTKSGNSQGGGNLSSNGNNSEQKDNKMKNLMNY
jgi:hypothetical protein